MTIYQKNIEFKKIFVSEAFSTIIVFACILFCSFFFNHYLILFSIVYFVRLFFISLYFLKYNKVDLLIIMVPGIYPDEVVKYVINMKLGIDIIKLKDNKIIRLN